MHKHIQKWACWGDACLYHKHAVFMIWHESISTESIAACRMHDQFEVIMHHKQM